jgi:UDP-N-acetylmuramoyl-tripeptide--D-alanyl-D-alanine ligase
VDPRLTDRVRKAATGAYDGVWYRRAVRHRRSLARVTFIGVTGEAGAGPAAQLVAAAVGARVRAAGGDPRDLVRRVGRGVLQARRTDEHWVEVVDGADGLEVAIRLLRPRVAVVTSPAEARLVASLAADGVAVLNGDDRRVMRLAGHCRGRVLTYGLGTGALLRAESVRAGWPDRLSFLAVHEGRSVPVRTRFCGVQWVPAFLAALATATAVEVPLERAAAALAGVEPLPGRFEPVEAGGVSFIRDDDDGSLASVGPALEVLAAARARTVAVIGTLTGYDGGSEAVYPTVARLALDLADQVVFVGRHARLAEAARSHPRGAALYACGTIREAHERLGRILRPGDLVLLKGSRRADHLARLLIARSRPIACWRTDCLRETPCERCLLLRVPELFPGPWRHGRG